MTPPPLPPDLFDALPPAVQAYIRYLEGRLADLEARLGQNSSDSSKPPSSDGPQVKPAPPTTPSGRRRGGQPGHSGHDRVLRPPDEVIDHKPTRCRRGAARLTADDPDPILDQVFDRPAKLRHVVHHRRHTPACPCCHAHTTAAPVPQAASGFGPKLTAAVAYLSGVGRVSKRTPRTLLDDLCGLPVSLGAVGKPEGAVRRALAPIHAAAHPSAQGKDANVDETGGTQGKARAWLWVAVTTLLTAFLIRPNRNRAAFDALVGPTPGVPTTDRFGVYTHPAGDRRRACWAHRRRDFQAMIDRRNGGSGVGEDLLLHADILFEHRERVRDGTRARRWFQRTHADWLRAEVKALLEGGSASACAKTAGVGREILGVEESLWTFARRAGVEPTNNAAERAARHAVCWRKTSSGTDGGRGRRFVERMLTVVASCRQQGRSVLDFLVKAVADQKPSLLPQGA